MKENFLCQFWQKRFRPCALRFLAEGKSKRAKTHFNPRTSLRATNGSAAIQEDFTKPEETPVGWVLTQQFKTAAFSLVEMLMALLVASLLMAALAPVMTKKLRDNLDINLFGSVSNMEACAFVADNPDVNVTDGKCTVPDEVTMASAIIVSGGGGGGGAQEDVEDNNILVSEAERGRENATSIYTTGIPGANSALNYSHNFTITKDMSDIEIELLSGGEGGGIGTTNGGGYPASQTDCGNWGVYVDYTQNAATNSDGSTQHSICVSRYNPSNTGDGLATPKSNITGVTNVTVGTSCSGGNCCWNGATSTTCQASGNGFTYSGCNRTVCQWNAANTICQNWKPVTTAGASSGRLPTQAELTAWVPYINNVSNTKSGVLNQPNGSFPGLQLCDVASGYGALQCEWGQNKCPGSIDGWCYPYHIWSDTLGSGTDYYRGVLYNGKFTVETAASYGYVRSVRCVLDNISEFIPRTGAGGMSGQYAKVKIPNEVLKKAFELTYDETTDTYINDPVDTLTLQIYGGAGGKAGTTDRGPYAGGMSFAALKKNGTSVWSINVYGGGHSSDTAPYNDAGNATSSRNGTPYSLTTSQGSGYLVYKNNYSSNKAFRKNVYNQKYSYFASEGVIIDFKTAKAGNTVVSSIGSETSSNTPGASGAAYWGGMYGTRGNTSETSHPGSGGKGGFCIQGPTRNAPVCTEPTSGTSGAAKLTYKRKYPGVGGNGGNSGSVLHIKNILVNKGDVITAQAGAGGGGGIANGDGRDGGSSFVEIKGKKFEVPGGKGGKTGIAANPSVANEAEKFAKPGAIQNISDSSILTSETRTNLNDINSYELFPANETQRNIMVGQQAPGNSNNDTTVYKSAGGNGGVNYKLTPLAGTKGIPCGAFSTTTIKIGSTEYKCGTNEFPTTSFDPVRLIRTISEDDLKNKASNYSKYYAPGATGGAGGAWSNDYKTGNESKTGQGGDGMGGYVLIYFK